MTNAEYWKQRFTQLEAAQNRKGATAYLEMEKQYKAAQNELEAQIARWYQRFADSNGISLAQAKQWLKGRDLAEFKWDVKEYIKYGKENAINGAWMQELENASSKFHISRLEALQIQTQNSLETMFAQQMGTMKKALSDVYASGYYHTAYTVQQGFGLGWDIAGLDQAQIEKVLSKPWAVDGYNFSTRIWMRIFPARSMIIPSRKISPNWTASPLTKIVAPGCGNVSIRGLFFVKNERYRKCLIFPIL